MGEIEGLRGGQSGSGASDSGAYSSTGSAGPDGAEQRVAALCEELLTRLPQQPFDVAAVIEEYPMRWDVSMNSVLAQELQRYNALLAVITSSLLQLRQTLSGEQLASESTDALFQAIHQGEVPAAWKKVSYPTERTLAGYVADLRRRLAFLETWAAEGHPSVFWLPGFFSPQAFLTGVLQDHARRQKAAIDRIVFRFEFQEGGGGRGEDPAAGPRRAIQSQTAPGSHIVGLYLEGAGWSPLERCLREAAAEDLFVQMPVIWLKPTIVAGGAIVPTSAGQDAKYACPLFRTPARRGALTTTGHSTNFVMYIDLPCGDRTPAHWTKRGAALLCQPPN